MSKTYIVTGSAGFIGSNLINTLLLNGDKMICLDKLSYASNCDYKRHLNNKNFIFRVIDISSKSFVKKIETEFLGKINIDGIFHLSANSHVDNSISNPEPFIYDNIVGTFNILELTKLFNIKLVMVSTDEVIGSIETGDGDENYLLKPNSVYSASKASSELLCRAYFITHKLNVCTTRCGNNFGLLQHGEKLIPKIIKNAQNDIKIPIYGDGKNIRQWTFVQNHIDDLILVMDNGKAGKIYHVGGGEHFTNNQIVEKILTKLNKPKSLIQPVKDRLGHDFRYSIKISDDILKWRKNKPYIGFNEGLDILLKENK